MLNAVPCLFSDNFRRVPYFLCEVSEVGVCWNEFLAGVILPVPCLTHDQDVVSTSEGVSVVSDWLKNDLTLISDSLVGAASVIVPLWDISNRVDLAVECSGLGSESNT